MPNELKSVTNPQSKPVRVVAVARPTNITCPECLKGKLMPEPKEQSNLMCPTCATEFIRTGPNSVKYKS